MNGRSSESGALEDEPAASDAGPRPPAVAALRLSGVSLLTRTEEGDVTIPDLGLTFDESGLTVTKASGEVVRLIPWPSLGEISSETAGRPNGVSPAALVRVSAGERVHRFVVPAVDAGALDQRLSDVTRRYKAPATGEPHERGGSNGSPVVGLVAVALGAPSGAPPGGASAPPPPPASTAAPAPGSWPAAPPAGAPPPPPPDAAVGAAPAPPEGALSATAPPAPAPPAPAPPASAPPAPEPPATEPPDVTGTSAGLGSALSSPVPVAPAPSRRRGRRRGEAPPTPPPPPPSARPGADAWPSGGQAGQAAPSEPGPATSLLPVVGGTVAGDGAVGSAFTEPPRPAGTPTAAERRRRRSIWALAVLVVIVAVLVGLYVAQREGLIHFLPKSVASPPSTTTAVTGASRTQGSTGSTTPRVASSPIPGMTSSDVTNLAQALEFHCLQANSTLTTCSQPANSAVLNVTEVPGGNVRLVTLTVGGLPGNPVVGNLVPKVAQLPYQGAQPAAASTWAHAHETSSGQVVIGSARLTMTSLPNQTILQISAA